VALPALPVLALGAYRAGLRRAILSLKYGRRDVAVALGALMAERAAPLLPPGRILVPVPTTRARRAERGFDQGSLLAEALGRASGLPVLALLRQTAGDAQRGRSRAERLEAWGRFACTSASLAEGSGVLLVDDVVTTGVTLRDCARALREAGAMPAGAVVAAYALKESR
jgi:ComF family protein